MLPNASDTKSFQILQNPNKSYQILPNPTESYQYQILQNPTKSYLADEISKLIIAAIEQRF